MKKIAIITHYYHKKTNSINILIDELFKNNHLFIDYFYIDKQASIGLDQTINGFDAVILVQFISLNILSKINCDNIIFIPMYDCSWRWDLYKWLECANLKILSLTKKTHDMLCSIGLNSYSIKYYPEPSEFIPGDLKKVFLWQRKNEININTSFKLLSNLTIDAIHIHKVVDPYNTFTPPSPTIPKSIVLTFSDWFGNKEDYFNILKHYGIYIAPRIREGGASAFIDAMKMGKVIIANNDSAMNEYIVHNESGFLYDIHNIHSIDFNSINLNEIQRNAYQSIQRGRVEWIKSIPNILDYIEAKNNYFISNKLIETLQVSNKSLRHEVDQLKIISNTLASNMNNDALYNFVKMTNKQKINYFKNFLVSKLFEVFNRFNKKKLLGGLQNLHEEVNIIAGNLEVKEKWISAKSDSLSNCQCLIIAKENPTNNFKLTLDYAFFNSNTLDEQHLSVITGYKGRNDTNMIAIFLHFTVKKNTHLYLRKNINGNWGQTEILIDTVESQGNLEVIKRENNLLIRCNDSKFITRKFEPIELKGEIGIGFQGAHFKNLNAIEI